MARGRTKMFENAQSISIQLPLDMIQQIDEEAARLQASWGIPVTRPDVIRRVLREHFPVREVAEVPLILTLTTEEPTTEVPEALPQESSEESVPVTTTENPVAGFSVSAA